MSTSTATASAEAQSTESLLSVSDARTIKPIVEGFLNRIRDVLIQGAPAANVEAASPTLVLALERWRFDHLLEQLNGAICVVGSVREAIREEGYEGGALQQAIGTLEHVASELDAALMRAKGSEGARSASADDEGVLAAADERQAPSAASEPAHDWRDMAQARGSIADMISSQPGGAEEALRRLNAGATLAQVCGAESAPEDAIPEPIRRHLLEQQQRACELQETLQMLANRINEGASGGVGCVRLALALNEGLDSYALRKVLEGSGEAQAA